MLIELSEKQARETAWCLLSSLEAALKLGLGDLVSERITLVHQFASPAIPTPEAVSTSSSPWGDPSHQQQMTYAVENMIHFLRTHPMQREQLKTYENLLHLMKASQKQTEEVHPQEKEQ